MSVPAMREQIKAILSGVSGIGIVHDYNRLATDWNKMLERFKDADGKINTVMFAREKMLKRVTTMGSSAPREKAQIFLMRVIMGLNDAQETGIAFDALLTAIEEKFDSHVTLNSTCRTTRPDWGPMAGQPGIQIDMIESRLFGSVLCHYAELRLCALEDVA